MFQVQFLTSWISLNCEYLCFTLKIPVVILETVFLCHHSLHISPVKPVLFICLFT